MQMPTHDQEKIVPIHFLPSPTVVYEVISESDSTVLVAIETKLQYSNDRSYITWFDTNKDRSKIIVKIFVDTVDLLVFLSTHEIIYTFRKLTVEQFRKRVAPLLPNAVPSHNLTEAEMTAQFMKTMEGM